MIVDSAAHPPNCVSYRSGVQLHAMAEAALSAGWEELAKWGWVWENQLDCKRTAGLEGVTLSRKAGYTKLAHNDYSAHALPLGLCPTESLPALLLPGKGVAGSWLRLKNNSHSLALGTLLAKAPSGAASVLDAS